MTLVGHGSAGERAEVLALADQLAIAEHVRVEPFDDHTCTFAPSFLEAPATSRSRPSANADTSLYEEPSLTATHFWEREPFDAYCCAFAPFFAEPPATFRT